MSMDWWLEAKYILIGLFGALIGWYHCWRTEMKARDREITAYTEFVQESGLNVLWHEWLRKRGKI
jgi:hypothetical protein